MLLDHLPQQGQEITETDRATRIFKLSPCMPATSVRRAPGCAWIESMAVPSGKRRHQADIGGIYWGTSFDCASFGVRPMSPQSCWSRAVWIMVR